MDPIVFPETQACVQKWINFELDITEKPKWFISKKIKEKPILKGIWRKLNEQINSRQRTTMRRGLYVGQWVLSSDMIRRIEGALMEDESCLLPWVGIVNGKNSPFGNINQSKLMQKAQKKLGLIAISSFIFLQPQHRWRHSKIPLKRWKWGK